MKGVRLRYTGIRIRDLKRSLRFYTKVIGLQVSNEGYMSHGGRFVNLVDKETGQHLELNWYPRRSQFYKAYKSGEELDHLGFEVGDARSSFADLISKGARPAVKPFYDGGYWLAFVKDPDGIWIELLSKARKKVR